MNCSACIHQQSFDAALTPTFTGRMLNLGPEMSLNLCDLPTAQRERLLEILPRGKSGKGAKITLSGPLRVSSTYYANSRSLTFQVGKMDITVFSLEDGIYEALNKAFRDEETHDFHPPVQ